MYLPFSPFFSRRDTSVTCYGVHVLHLLFWSILHQARRFTLLPGSDRIQLEFLLPLIVGQAHCWLWILRLTVEPDNMFMRSIVFFCVATLLHQPNTVSVMSAGVLYTLNTIFDGCGRPSTFIANIWEDLTLDSKFYFTLCTEYPLSYYIAYYSISCVKFKGTIGLIFYISLGTLIHFLHRLCRTNVPL